MLKRRSVLILITFIAVFMVFGTSTPLDGSIPGPGVQLVKVQNA